MAPSGESTRSVVHCRPGVEIGGRLVGAAANWGWSWDDGFVLETCLAHLIEALQFCLDRPAERQLRGAPLEPTREDLRAVVVAIVARIVAGFGDHLAHRMARASVNNCRSVLAVAFARRPTVKLGVVVAVTFASVSGAELPARSPALVLHDEMSCG
jgi:hypothetical protein